MSEENKVLEHRVSTLEGDVKEIKEDVKTFRDHVVGCDASMKEMIKWLMILGIGGLALLGLGGHDEAITLLQLFGG